MFNFSFVRTTGNLIMLISSMSIISRQTLWHDVGLQSFSMAGNDTSMRGPTTPSFLAIVEPLSSKAYVVIISPLPLPLTLTGTIGNALYSWLPQAIETLLFITTWSLWGCVRFEPNLTLGPCSQFSSCLLRKLARKPSWSEHRCFFGKQSTKQHYTHVDSCNQKQNEYRTGTFHTAFYLARISTFSHLIWLNTVHILQAYDHHCIRKHLNRAFSRDEELPLGLEGCGTHPSTCTELWENVVEPGKEPVGTLFGTSLTGSKSEPNTASFFSLAAPLIIFSRSLRLASLPSVLISCNPFLPARTEIEGKTSENLYHLIILVDLIWSTRNSKGDFTTFQIVSQIQLTFTIV